MIATGHASMGPHSTECGNDRRHYYVLPDGRASMGPHSTECGNVTACVAPSGLAFRFNGAALN